MPRGFVFPFRDAELAVPLIVDVGVGPFTYNITSDRVMIPAAFQDTSTNTVRVIQR